MPRPDSFEWLVITISIYRTLSTYFHRREITIFPKFDRKNEISHRFLNETMAIDPFFRITQFDMIWLISFLYTNFFLIIRNFFLPKNIDIIQLMVRHRNFYKRHVRRNFRKKQKQRLSTIRISVDFLIIFTFHFLFFSYDVKHIYHLKSGGFIIDWVRVFDWSRKKGKL